MRCSLFIYVAQLVQKSELKGLVDILGPGVQVWKTNVVLQVHSKKEVDLFATHTPF